MSINGPKCNGPKLSSLSQVPSSLSLISIFELSLSLTLSLSLYRVTTKDQPPLLIVSSSLSTIMGVPAESRRRSQGRRELRLTAEIMDAGDLRRRTVKRFMEDLGSVVSGEERNAIDDAIRHVVQEVKLLAKKEDREGLDSSINELLLLGMQRFEEHKNRTEATKTELQINVAMMEIGPLIHLKCRSRNFSKGWHLCQLEVLDCKKVAWPNSVTEEKYCVEDCGWPLKEFAYECKINLLTGRTHQIRAQLAACGAPIVGDSMYVLAAIAEMISPGLNPFGKYKKQCTSEYDKAMAMQEWISYEFSDVAAKILSFSQKGPPGICVLSANGTVSNVTIRQPGSSGGVLTYESVSTLYAGVDFTPHVVTVYTGEFPSMASLHGALPNVAAPAGLLSTSSLGSPSTSWMPSQSSYPSAMPAQVQGVMADSAVKMVKAGCQYITVLGVDFMSENVRAILYQAGFLEECSIGGESLRIYKCEIQENVLEIVGISPEQAEAKFGYLLEALDMGAPSHGVEAPRNSLEMDQDEHFKEAASFPSTMKEEETLNIPVTYLLLCVSYYHFSFSKFL
ncbi:unnamed protein product [Camellia sinensis]